MGVGDINLCGVFTAAPQMGEACSAMLQTSAEALVQSVEVLAPQDNPARHLNRLSCAESLAWRAFVWHLYMSCQLSFTPKYVGNGYH